MGEIQQEYICWVTKCTLCCSQLLYHNKDRLFSHSWKVLMQRNRNFPVEVKCSQNHNASLCADPFTSPESGWGRRPCICAPDLAEPSDPRSSRRTPAPRCCSDAKSEERERFSLNAVWFIHSPSQRWARSQLTVPWTGSGMLTCPLRNWNLNTTGKKMSPWLLS